MNKVEAQNLINAFQHHVGHVVQMQVLAPGKMTVPLPAIESLSHDLVDHPVSLLVTVRDTDRRLKTHAVHMYTDPVTATTTLRWDHHQRLFTLTVAEDHSRLTVSANKRLVLPKFNKSSAGYPVEAMNFGYVF